MPEITEGNSGRTHNQTSANETSTQELELVANQRSFDAIVIGNGALGLSLALVLARGGTKVAVLGEPTRPGGASAAAGAMLGCFGEVTAATLASEHGRVKHELAVAARGRWSGWLASLAEDTGETTPIRGADGTVVILNTVGMPGIDDVNFAAIRAALDRHGEPYEDVEPAQVDWLDPDAKSRPVRAMLIPGEQAVDAATLLRQLVRAVERNGGTVIPGTGVRVERSRGQATAVTLSTGERLLSHRIVVAAGARSQELLDTLPDIAAQIPRLVSGYGVSALLRTEDGTAPRTVIRTPNRAFACGLHVVPRSGGEVYVGATNIISPDCMATPVLRDVVFLLNCASRQVRRNLWMSGTQRIQVGNRPVALDGFPLLGATGLDGLWLMTGTYRDGLHLSPLLAHEMSKAVLGEATDTALSIFTPVRHPVQPASRKEIIDTAVSHMLATGYEYDWTIPVEWPSIIEHNMRPSYEKFTEELNPVYTPPPELLAASRVSPSLYKMLRDYYASLITSPGELPARAEAGQ